MQCSLGDQRIVIVYPEHLSTGQRSDDKGDCLKLCSGLRYAVFVDTKRLNIKIVRKIFETTFVSDLGREEEEAEGDCGCFNLGGENRGELADEFENIGNFRLPIFFLSRSVG